MHKVPFEPHGLVRVGLIGAGGRGQSLLGELLGCPGVQVTRVADVQARACQQAAARITSAGHAPPATFAGENGWQQLLAGDLDLVYIATPWATHTPYALAAMQAGKHVAVEVPAATTLEQCWQLVESSERTRRHCIMLENCCYDYWEMLIKRMVYAGLLGSITHAECAYIHDLRSMLLSDVSEGLWRREPHITQNGNLYPTHGLGPVAQCLRIGQEDAFDYLVSMSSQSIALGEYRDSNLPLDDAKRREHYQCGDMNVSLIRTKLGRTIVLQHDVVTPRPYERGFLIAGSKGTFRDYPPRLYLDGVSTHELWSSLDPYRAQWEDPLWTLLGEQARQGGHGGMDYVMTWRLLQIMHEGLPPDSDVYDAAEWSAPGPLSEQSVAKRSAAVDFPDFRRS
jgi:Oxidoreductase family, NAD-binding Rossmann fold